MFSVSEFQDIWNICFPLNHLKRTYISLQPRNTNFNLAKTFSLDVLIFSLIRKECQDSFWSRKKNCGKTWFGCFPKRTGLHHASRIKLQFYGWNTSREARRYFLVINSTFNPSNKYHFTRKKTTVGKVLIFTRPENYSIHDLKLWLQLNRF